MVGPTLPIHWLRLIEHSRMVGGYPARDGTQGHHWCDQMVDMGLLKKRGMFRLDCQAPHAESAAREVLHVYDTTIKGRELIGKPYPNDPTCIAVPDSDSEYKNDDMFGQF